MAYRLLAYAAARGRVAYVFFVGNQLSDWGISDRATNSPEKAIKWAEKHVKMLSPDAIITEDIRFAKKKGDPAKAIINAIADVGAANALLNPQLKREHDYANKYQEADAIAEQYPELTPWLPKHRRFFDNEERATVLFEAMSYALSILRSPSTTLAAAMG